jgi:hypothetical protein
MSSLAPKRGFSLSFQTRRLKMPVKPVVELADKQAAKDFIGEEIENALLDPTTTVKIEVAKDGAKYTGTIDVKAKG